MKYDNVLFAVDSRTNGIYGRRYKNLAQAISAGSYAPWDSDRIKSAFQFGNGTLKDFRRHCKDNGMTILTAKEFFNIFNQLPDEAQKRHMQFISELLHY